MALSKQLRKLTIKTKRLWQLKFFSFVNFNDYIGTQGPNVNPLGRAIALNIKSTITMPVFIPAQA
jgi:hypothetical protein